MNMVKMICPEKKYFIKCPYGMTPIGITVHNTANDASAINEVKYMISNDNATSFHFAIDDVNIVQGIPEGRNAWHAGDGGKGVGNRSYLSVEICYSKSGGEKFEKAMKNAAWFIAVKCIQYGWTIENVKKHQDFSGKYCPHRILDTYGWPYFLNLVQEEMNKMADHNPVLFEGAKGDYVKVLQKRLNEWGYVLAVDGSFGPATREAVKHFQGNHKLEVNGVVDPVTWTTLLDDIIKDSPFTDIVGNSAYNVIVSLANKGILHGYEDGTFKPDKLCTRAELAYAISALLEYLDK